MVKKIKSPKEPKEPPNPFYQPEEPQEGLVPVVGPFYATPSEPADPMDCDRYPDSPWCGGNPIDITPLDFAIDVVQDECNFGVQFSGTLGFIKLPPFQIVYRNPECQPEPEPPPQEEDYEEELQIPYSQGIYFLYTSEAGVIEEIDFEDGKQGVYISVANANIANVALPYTGDIKIPATSAPRIKITPQWALTFNVSYDTYYNGARYNLVAFPVPRVDDGKNYNFSGSQSFTIYGDSDTTYVSVNTDPKVVDGILRMGEVFNFRIFQSRSQLDRYFAYQKSIGHPVKKYRKTTNQFYRGYPLKRIDFNIPAFYGAPIPFLPLPPPPPKEECCKMGCCPNNSNLETLLRLILRKIGSDALPASVPRLLTRKDAGVIPIQNLAQFISYTVKQLDALAGGYPLEIKIKDADLTQEGNQEKKVSLPNIAEALAEIMGILLTLQSESNANLIATTNSMIEAGSAKQSAILAVDYSKANAEYLGYKGKQVERKVPFTFKPGEPRLDKMLASGEVKVKGWENDDKEDLNDALAPLLELAAMWKAANFKNLGTDTPLTKLKESLRGAVDISKAVDKLVNTPSDADPNNPDAPTPERKKNEWDSFIEEAEQGFIAQPGITNTTDPYSRPLAQRPKIREIGNDTSDTEDQGQ
jgi:hypothetical protein